MIQLDRKMTIILVIIVVGIIIGAAAAVMMQPEEEEKKKPKPVEMEKDVSPVSGWVDNPEAGDATTAVVSVGTNDTELVSVTINVLIKDDDGNHEQTDEGSEPDSMSVTVGGEQTFEVTTDRASGEGNITKEYGASDIGMFESNITVELTGSTFGGGKHPTGPGGIVPIPFLVYVDQGIYYQVSISYTYLDYSGNAPKKDTTDEDKE